jgi:hypothetical protein
VPIVLKSGSLNLLEPLEPVQACNEIALLLWVNKSCEAYQTRSKKDILHLADMALQANVIIHLHFYFLNLSAHNMQYIPIDKKKPEFSVSPHIPQMRPDVPFHS